jgi:hypothetical protein
VSYDFGRLGFLQFEQLCALLLELEGGVAQGAWVGEADRLRSVLSGSRLGRPLVPTELPEPVLIQCAWARSGLEEELLDRARALAVECPEDFAVARSFVLLTHLGVEGDFVKRVASTLDGPRVEVVVVGADNLAERTDASVELRRSMPSLLGIADLRNLIEPELERRASLDRDAALALAPVFVPTRAYRRALDVLNRYRFAVLTGPPEMGKTAIARMLGLAQMTAGWEAHECVRPEQLWSAFNPRAEQVFVADDAFGSTEYRPEAAERWAREMERILRALDDRHWLIWTSRPAPLRAGLGRIHRERGAERFPAPAEVLVDASQLDPGEKTLILFRHAKAADLPYSAKAAIRRQGAEIVGHPHFTPERIRRFVATIRTLAPDTRDVSEIVEQELTNATEAMATSFAALSPELRDLLIAMLDSPPGPISERELTSALRRHHDGPLTKAPAELVDRLTDHFVRVVA